ncbi:tRNA pseudouridine(55) synthase TruB [Egbenema bharatensis]|uniref:tRNA pseudouridine(55) synthase TruB n=1 Tax=Egbenema bharatensis TaxID=3463334 RepID=UPI003A87A2A8
MNGFLNLNKPAGFTSHDCVARVRKLLRTKKVGHGGTLDPAATGVLPIAIGQATRLLQYLNHNKAYRATIRFGLKTTTDDLEGEVLESAPAAELTLDKVQFYLPQFIGTIEQIPPSYSAIQVGGKRLYELARSGEQVEAPVRTVQIDQIDLLEWRSGEFPELDLMIACGTGTYIRSIARDLGELVGTGGTLAALQRTQSNGFSLETSLTLEDLTHQIESQTFQPIPPNPALQHLATLHLSPEAADRWCKGQRIPWTSNCPNEEKSQFYRVLNETDRFLGIGQPIDLDNIPHLAPKLVWTAPS